MKNENVGAKVMTVLMVLRCGSADWENTYFGGWIEDLGVWVWGVYVGVRTPTLGGLKKSPKTAYALSPKP